MQQQQWQQQQMLVCQLSAWYPWWAVVCQGSLRSIVTTHRSPNPHIILRSCAGGPVECSEIDGLAFVDRHARTPPRSAHPPTTYASRGRHGCKHRPTEPPICLATSPTVKVANSPSSLVKPYTCRAVLPHHRPTAHIERGFEGVMGLRVPPAF